MLTAYPEQPRPIFIDEELERLERALTVAAIEVDAREELAELRVRRAPTDCLGRRGLATGGIGSQGRVL